MKILEDLQNNIEIMEYMEAKFNTEVRKLREQCGLEALEDKCNKSRDKVREYVEGIILENPTHLFDTSDEAEEFDEIYSDPPSRIEVEECIPYNRTVTKYVHTFHDKLVIYVEYKREIQDLNMYHDYVFLVERFEI
jgi:hypothetical protein